jgi:hypothetical protein
MIFMLENTILAYEGSMITTKIIGNCIRMIFAEYLEYIMSLSKNTFDLLIYLERNLLISVNIAVVIAMTVCAFKIIFLCYTSLRILRRFDHLGYNAIFACSHWCTAIHNNRLSRCKIESFFAFKTFQKAL